jgi:uncharacterized membrane protein YbhN (UPF0104 family)
VIARVATSRPSRAILGLVISAVFILATLSRVDLVEVGAALARVHPAGLALALALVLVEVGLRTLRWQLLLRPVHPIGYRSSLAYMCIGYFANSLLPARLGDIARAYLAGGRFGIARVAILGTILVERLADGFTILAIVAVLGIVVAGGGSLATSALGLGALALVGFAGAGSAVLLARRTGILRTRIGALVTDVFARLAAGAVAIRDPRGAARVEMLTLLPFAVAVVAFDVVARAAGVELTPAQAALAMGGVALSTSVPAAPGSLGTYEFVGVTILVSFGVPAEPALATVLLVHLIATLPTALVGLVAAWRLHFWFGAIAPDAAVPVRLIADPARADAR